MHVFWLLFKEKKENSHIRHKPTGPGDFAQEGCPERHLLRPRICPTRACWARPRIGDTNTCRRPDTEDKDTWPSVVLREEHMQPSVARHAGAHLLRFMHVRLVPPRLASEDERTGDAISIAGRSNGCKKSYALCLTRLVRSPDKYGHGSALTIHKFTRSVVWFRI